jgi:hypothetical protein
MPSYTLTRTLPDGTVRANPTPLRTLREVEFAVAYCLMDNSRVPRGEARRFAADFAHRPAGEQMKHEGSGYAFRVDRV